MLASICPVASVSEPYTSWVATFTPIRARAVATFVTGAYSCYQAPNINCVMTISSPFRILSVPDLLIKYNSLYVYV